MGYSYYLINENKQVAIEIPRRYYEDLFYESEEIKNKFDELMDYLMETPKEEWSLDVIKYLTKYILMIDSLTVMVAMLKEYGFDKLIYEEDFLKKNKNNKYTLISLYN